VRQAPGPFPALVVRVALDVLACGEWTPFGLACAADALDAARVLVEAGADIDARNKEGYTPPGRVTGTATELIAFMRSRGARET
jgi:hypothetical protein